MAEIVKDWPCTVNGNIGVSIKGITEHSSNVKEGYLFVARKGKKDDGLLHIQEALERGAAAIVTDRYAYCAGQREEVPFVLVPDSRRFLSYACAKMAGNPSKRLTVIAVTGTNGKTTVTHFIGQLLLALGVRVAVLGTTGIFVNGVKWKIDVPEMTTLPPEYLHPLLKRCEDEGITHIVMEASSLGLSTLRLEHCDIDIGVFLNLGIDHYEEHGGKLAYFMAKKKLSTMADQLVVNMDDSNCIAMVNDATAEIYYFNEFMVANEWVPDIQFSGAVLGRHNKMNAMAAISVVRLMGYSLSELLPFCQTLVLPAGRLQRMEIGGIAVYIDYAHTPDALEAVLEALRTEWKGGLITVFGCGGDRDRGKRPKMGQIAGKYSSSVIITSDNPRSEDPLDIMDEIQLGIDSARGVQIEMEPDRKEAIRKAIFQAREGDVILIAGKGHEETQQTAFGITSFSDYRVAMDALLDKNKIQPIE
ncbi:UDP-N-acetylmuramoyl-L-alanyl-D-glutamate--2,6-diaminopimelate ligase [Sporosarcina contaminans]|uniref:UDP-N-acetylmuramoyl-L-alanyl-D-glutamate--2,6-diaminopimelate ligase n=1 Tax=Sporosarcina contaminans TaxID=633403 RepID=A0ABW3TTF5_9BACL